MKVRSPTTMILGLVLSGFGIFLIVIGASIWALVPLLIGVSLCYLGWRGGRVALLVFGHICIALGCFMITWGIYLLPYSEPILSHIFALPLFWGLISLFGGICANYHGFCKCIRK